MHQEMNLAQKIVQRLALLVWFAACVVVPAASGTISVAWQLQTLDGQPVQCLPGEVVSITAAGFRFDSPCDQYAAQTGFIPEGTYTAVFTLFPTQGPSVSISQVVTIFRNATTNLGLITFNVPPSPLNGSATFTWALHRGDAGAPP